MATPLRDDGSPGPQKHLVVFVHGFKSSASCWNDLISLLEVDRRFVDYEFRRYEYPTSAFHVGFLTRLPTLKELGRGLGGFLDKCFGDENGEAYINITLIGHSMGELVIQSWLVDQLEQNRGSDLKQIRQIVLLACPNRGSRIASALRKFAYAFFPNPQERLLRIFDPEIDRIDRIIQSNVTAATGRRDNQCPIPIHAFWGERDAVVEQLSAQGSFPNASPLAADHFSILSPTSSSDDLYIQISDTILFPVGHQQVFEVAEFRFLVKVEPRSQDFSYMAEHGGKRRTVQTDNFAHLQREARFSRNNRCRETFAIKYRTRNVGFVKYEVSHPNLNLASAESIGLCEDSGTSAIFEFRPEPQQKYSLNIDVYKGFDQGHCDVHHHIHPNSYFRKYLFELDLSSYIAAGYKTQKQPSLCFVRHDPGCSGLCSERNKMFPDVPSSVSEAGIWRWQLDHLREGVVDVRWAIE